MPGLAAAYDYVDQGQPALGLTKAARGFARIPGAVEHEPGRALPPDLTAEPVPGEAERRVLGQAKLGGVIFALETLKFNDTNTVLYRGAVHCVGPVQILQYWFGDVKTGLGAGSGGFVPDSVYQGKVVIEGHAGTEDQPASAALLKLPYWTDAIWLKGLCFSVVVATGRQMDALGGKRDRMDEKLEGVAYRRDIEHFVARDEIERRIDKAVDGAKAEAAKGLAEVALPVRDLRKIGWRLASPALLAFGGIVLAKVGPAGR
ncbi:hypothetical protein [Methylobacterium sp. B1]|uniref:hypothetical protein n=1 Tax=Methylobacterium sp. B1 TaxID=91459 RepID=UPI0011D1CD0B|nr:hypothetical protein [Methylobacterium sp. B1]